MLWLILCEIDEDDAGPADEIDETIADDCAADDDDCAAEEDTAAEDDTAADEETAAEEEAAMEEEDAGAAEEAVDEGAAADEADEAGELDSGASDVCEVATADDMVDDSRWTRSDYVLYGDREKVNEKLNDEKPEGMATSRSFRDKRSPKTAFSLADRIPADTTTANQ